ncbi:hypothetical protein ACO0LB_11715 [Undibacterium sp. SXout7W]|uniref:hypothetical protein n=1 Tax=Undibacterium sp. SXout7W TaxID=3413049 RepID=UPI003BF00841
MKLPFMSGALCALACISLLSACGNMETASSQQGVLDDNNYVTGSNLPQRGKRVQTMTPEQAEEMRRGANIPVQGK